MRRRRLRIMLLATPLLMAGCASVSSSPTAGLARAEMASYPGGAYGPSLVAGDALAFEIMLARGFDTPDLAGPGTGVRHASAPTASYSDALE